MKYPQRLTGMPHGSRSPLRGAWIEIVEGPAVRAATAQGRSPLRGAWIEICVSPCSCQRLAGRSPLRGAWIEITRRLTTLSQMNGRSPLRGAWIEIMVVIYNNGKKESLPLAGSVD